MCATNVARLPSTPGQQINRQVLAFAMRHLLKLCCACLCQLPVAELFAVYEDGLKG